MDQSIQDLLGQVTMKQEKEIAKMVFFFYPHPVGTGSHENK